MWRTVHSTSVPGSSSDSTPGPGALPPTATASKLSPLPEPAGGEGCGTPELEFVPMTRPRRPRSFLTRLGRKLAKGLLTRDTCMQRWVRTACFLALLYMPRRFRGRVLMRLERTVIFEWSAARRFLPRQNLSLLEAFLVARARRRLARAAGPDLAAPLLALALDYFSYEIRETADPTRPPFRNDGPLLWFLFRHPIFFPDQAHFRRAVDFY